MSYNNEINNNFNEIDEEDSFIEEDVNEDVDNNIEPTNNVDDEDESNSINNEEDDNDGAIILVDEEDDKWSTGEIVMFEGTIDELKGTNKTIPLIFWNKSMYRGTAVIDSEITLMSDSDEDNNNEVG